MLSSKKPSDPQTQDLNVIHYLGIVICGGLTVLGIYYILTNRIEDGIINIIIGTSLLFSFIPFDYNKSLKWQKAGVIIYGLFLLVGIIYILYMGFNR